MLRPKASINPTPAPRPLAECIAVDVLALEKRDGKLPTCYICFETDRVEPSPCYCEAAVHVYPCLELCVEKTGDSKCTICRSEFNSSALQALAAAIVPTALPTASPTTSPVAATACQRWCGIFMAFLFNLLLSLIVGAFIFNIVNAIV